MNDFLTVKVDSKVSGILSFEENEYIFSYKTEDKKEFISLTMPVRAKSWNSKNLHPLFEMHLPEGYLLSIIKKHFSKFTKTDDSGLLKLMSPSIKGRVSYEQDLKVELKPLVLDDLLHSSNEKLFDELVSRFALNSPISGVQPKVLAQIENKATLKLEDYIVKSWGEEYQELALNEYLCMRVVQKANICVPEFYLSQDRKLFIMKRFDIKEDNTYLGFEDMCVLFGKNRDDKYEGTYEQIAKTIKTFVSPKYKKESLSNFFKMIVINFLLKNGDAHLKNFGLIYEDISNIRLAPAYDVVTTTVYIKNDIPALHLLGSKKWWKEKQLLRFGIEFCDLTAKEVKELYELCVKAKDEIIEEAKSYKKDEELSEFIDNLIKKWS
ncbi:serine/threonine-protein kinase HipA [Malaciobacter marinus]|jgi:serine/threonine-protein kinase HipA|uniref:Serine/threonine-protein kinase HipA n=1 Tax=Malaciobacter marinus TaxID=505249 RepID=A0AB36ZWR2_9BACT|nr:type II toxin-antitoxin system HipA family toxin [Malaciobacter marinus]PPK61515.1 serine/threonine-protein kinase HipA [Malaciobacter marinus]SKB57529.1 serine/threonine-protein kinase HipA [Malaciobacter marinus]